MEITPSFNVHLTSEGIVLTPAPGRDGSPVVLRARVLPNGELSIAYEKDDQFDIGAVTRTVRCFGITGAILLPDGPHLLAITGQSYAGNVLGAAWYKAAQIEEIPFPNVSGSIGEATPEDVVTFHSLLQSGLRNSMMFFASEYPVTYSLGRAFARGLLTKRGEIPNDSLAHSPVKLIESADERFLWNYSFLQYFRSDDGVSFRSEIGPYLVALVSGSVSVSETSIDDVAVTFVVISRRSRHRTGTRYHRRGIDKEGKVANYAETEQIVCGASIATSFAQVRGSVPLPWGQTLTLKYTPGMWLDLPEITPPLKQVASPRRSEGKSSPVDPLAKYYVRVPATAPLIDPAAAFAKHMDMIAEDYGGMVTTVDLLNWHGFENRLHDLYAKHAELYKNKGGDIHHCVFDFHAECSRMRWHNLKKLVDACAPDVDSQRFTMLEALPDESSFSQKWRVCPEMVQTGAFRVNCLDSLDRTNVAQSMFANRSLSLQLPLFGVSKSTAENLSDHFVHMFKNVWADNADAVAIAYAGTGALKTDFTRTGKRTKVGALMDGVNSIKRYIFNNFSDGTRQDAIDVSVGLFAASAPNVAALPPASVFPWPVMTAFYVLFGFLMLTLTGKLGRFNATTVIVAFAIFVAALARSVVHLFGHRLVNLPRLLPVNGGTPSVRSPLLEDDSPGSPDSAVLVRELKAE